MKTKSSNTNDRNGTPQSTSRKFPLQHGSGIVLGISLGVALGAAFDNVGIGIALGVAFGAAMEGVITKMTGKCED